MKLNPLAKRLLIGAAVGLPIATCYLKPENKNYLYELRNYKDLGSIEILEAKPGVTQKELEEFLSSHISGRDFTVTPKVSIHSRNRNLFEVHIEKGDSPYHISAKEMRQITVGRCSYSDHELLDSKAGK